MTNHTIALAIFFLIAINTKGLTQSGKETLEEEVYEVDSEYVETRKIKYLYQEDNDLFAFFDNGKGSKCENCDLCKGSIDKLFFKPTLYDYRVDRGLNLMIFSKPEDKYDVGLKLSNSDWIIKDFVSHVDIKDCNENQAFRLVIMNDDDSYDKFLNLVKTEYGNQRIPVIYYYADWCGPCKKFKKVVETDSEALHKLRKFTFIQADLSNLSNCKSDTTRFGDILACMDENRSNHVPMFCKVDIEGKPVNWITGASWIYDKPQRIEGFIELIKRENVKTHIKPVEE